MLASISISMVTFPFVRTMRSDDLHHFCLFVRGLCVLETCVSHSYYLENLENYS